MITLRPLGRPTWKGHLFWESIEEASRFPIGPVPIPDEHERGFLAMSVRMDKRSARWHKAARPWIPNALTVRPMTRNEARANEGGSAGDHRRMDQTSECSSSG